MAESQDSGKSTAGYHILNGSKKDIFEEWEYRSLLAMLRSIRPESKEEIDKIAAMTWLTVIIRWL